ncbi:hypothetical protein ACFOWE_04420 [Planomonospora corallina]|uniref:Uncharacterized protein n=1 Tax=Planomonospora corallina TaxID=1806052 RepID=A0ABV8I557_9ACTN
MKEIRRDDDGALLGYIRQVDGGWQPLTVFGHPLGAPGAEEDASGEVHRTGLDVLMRPWEFFEGGRWYRCVILEAAADAVRVRPADPDYPGDAYTLVLERPGPNTLRPEQ